MTQGAGQLSADVPTAPRCLGCRVATNSRTPCGLGKTHRRRDAVPCERRCRCPLRRPALGTCASLCLALRAPKVLGRSPRETNTQADTQASRGVEGGTTAFAGRQGWLLGEEPGETGLKQGAPSPSLTHSPTHPFTYSWWAPPSVQAEGRHGNKRHMSLCPGLPGDDPTGGQGFP